MTSHAAGLYTITNANVPENTVFLFITTLATVPLKNHEIAKKAPALPELSPRSKTVCFEPAGTVKQT